MLHHKITRRGERKGDLLELSTQKGLAYVQIATKKKGFGHLIRVLPGLYGNRPDTLENLVEGPEQFLVYFPVSAAVRRGILRLVDNKQVPDRLKRVPPMRRPGAISREGRVLNWFIVEGDQERLTRTLSDEERRYSLSVVWNDTMLIERITEGWSPEREL